MNAAAQGYAFLITCEHGGKRIPAAYRDCFAGQEALLSSHRGYDPGALTLARAIAAQLDAPLLYSTISRLLVDLNRSPRHPRLHGERIRLLPIELRHRILERHYLPFRARVEALIENALANGKRVIHISSHSFTPVLDGIVRQADIGLLYDPARGDETAFCHACLLSLKARAPALRVRRNYPYRGKSDGFTASLRRRFKADDYLGIEIEINQDIVHSGAQRWRQRRLLVQESLADAIARFGDR
jgi:predicted N-formylglutamate amidohydrolase